MKIIELFITHRVFTLSNFLSLSRIIFILPLSYFILYEGENYNYYALLIVSLMVASDYFDGALARKLGQETPLGQYLDPVADKIAILIGLYLLYAKRDYPLAIFLFIFLREVVGTFYGMFLLTKRNLLGKPNYWGKVGVFAIAISGVWYLMDWPHKEWTNIPVLFLLTGGIISYFIRYRRTVWK
ncbi:MAG: CDP-alcohol phosphatidyltransferase family protein [Leptospirales bacterium]